MKDLAIAAKKSAEKLSTENAKTQEEADKAKAEGGGDETEKTEEAGKKDVAETPLEPEEIDFDNLYVFGIRDVIDVGQGIPLFKDFTFEDWTMMTLRFELHLLAHSFRRDVADPERTGIHLDNLAFYYNIYYRKQLQSRYFGKETNMELFDLVWDTVFINKQHVLETKLPEDMDSFQIFVKLTEEERRFRNIKIELGEDAALKFQQIPCSSGQKGGFVDNKGGKGASTFQQPRGGIPGWAQGFQAGGCQNGSFQGGCQGGFGNGNQGGNFQGGCQTGGFQANFSGAYGADKGGGKAHHSKGGKREPRAGDWTCPSCGYKVWESRNRCYRCNQPKPATMGGYENGTFGNMGNNGNLGQPVAASFGQPTT